MTDQEAMVWAIGWARGHDYAGPGGGEQAACQALKSFRAEVKAEEDRQPHGDGIHLVGCVRTFGGCMMECSWHGTREQYERHAKAMAEVLTKTCDACGGGGGQPKGRKGVHHKPGCPYVVRVATDGL